MRKYPILRVLLRKNMITYEKAQELMQIGEGNDINEFELLESSRVINEEKLVALLGEFFQLEIVDLEQITIQDGAFAEIPANILGLNHVLPIHSTAEELTIAITDPTDVNGLESLTYYTKKKLVFVLARPSQIQKLYQLQISQAKSNEAVESLVQEFTDDTVLNLGTNIDDESDAPTIQLTNAILLEAITSEASDIHIEPYEHHLMIRYRVDGVLKEAMDLPISIYQAIIARLKLICGMDISERRVPQEGRLEVSIHDQPVDLRFSTIPNLFGEKLVIRILQKKFMNSSITELGFNTDEYEKVKMMLHRSNGIILVTGPTGSGKSTTLYSFLNHIKTPEKSIVTVEDPVEYTIEGFNQTQVNIRQGLTFPICLRAILRQDPDIIMIGEMRDEETAEIAVRASITGHLVLSTLHTNTAISSISRMINMGIEPYLIADSLRGVIAQRLMRQLCPDCKEKKITTSVEMELLNLEKPTHIYHACGCKSCNYTGYKGRFAVFEVLYINSEMKRSIQNAHDVSVMEQAILKTRFPKLYDSGIAAVLQGKSTIQELRRLDNEES